MALVEAASVAPRGVSSRFSKRSEVRTQRSSLIHQDRSVVLDQMFLDEVATAIREAEALTGDAEAKRHGFSDRQIAAMRGLSE